MSAWDCLPWVCPGLQPNRVASNLLDPSSVAALGNPSVCPSPGIASWRRCQGTTPAPLRRRRPVRVSLLGGSNRSWQSHGCAPGWHPGSSRGGRLCPALAAHAPRSPLQAPGTPQPRAPQAGSGNGSPPGQQHGESLPASETPLTSALSAAEFRENAHRMVDYIADYYEQVQSMPVRSQVEPGYLAPLLPASAPEDPETLEAVLHDVTAVIIPGMSHWQHPGFFAYYPANSSTGGLLGDMLSAALNCIGFSWVAAPAATELETLMLDWLGRLMQLPPAFLAVESGGSGGGVIQGTASEAVLVALLAARERALAASGRGHTAGAPGHPGADPDSRNGNGRATSWGASSDDRSRLVAFTSDQAHSCVVKACRVAGLGARNLRLIPARAENEYALDPDDLQAAIDKARGEGLVPFFICATVGTTSSAAIDPLPAIGRISQECGAWLHVDAAYAGSACVCPEFRGCLDGVDLADSLCINAHKWLLTNFDCSCLWLKQSSDLVSALSSQPEFLRNKASDAQLVVDYKDWQVPLGRRFRALKLWLVMRLYGASGLRQHIRHHIGLAQRFTDLVRADPRFEVAVPPKFSLVCFRLKGGKSPQENRQLNEALLESVNSSGEAFLTHTVLSGTYVIRMAIGGSQTAQEHVDRAWCLIQENASVLLVDEEEVFLGVP